MESVTPRNPARLIAGALLVVVGLARGIGGFAMMAQGTAVLGTTAASDAVIRIAGAIAFILSGCVFVAGVFLVRGGRGRLYAFGATAVILLFLDGFWNGWLLFGAARIRGQMTNGLVAAIMVAMLAFAASRDRTT